MDDDSSNSKNRNLGGYANGVWTCRNFPCDASNHLDDSKCFDFLCGAAISPVQDDDECEFMLHFRCNPKVLVFWTLVQPPLLVVLRVQRLCFPRFMKMVHEFQMSILLVVDHSIW